MTEEKKLAERLNIVKAEVADAAGKAGRAVTLVAVGKTFGEDRILEAAAAGQCDFGENYAVEGCAKIDWFRENHPEMKLVWHFIGPLQANKTRQVAERFDWVQTVTRMRVAQRLSDQRPAGMAPLNVLIEVNIDAEESKSGVAPSEVAALAREIATLPNLKLRGLMAIPAPKATREERLVPLRAMRALFDELAPEFGFDTLSMGMSADCIEAVDAGSTMVRVGSAIFGHRTYPATAASGATDTVEKE